MDKIPTFQDNYANGMPSVTKRFKAAKIASNWKAALRKYSIKNIEIN
jgi:hypothetical protein